MRQKTVLNSLILLLSAALLISCKESTGPDNGEDPKPPGYQEEIPWPSLADSPWPMFFHDPQNTNRSNLEGPQQVTATTKIPVFLKSGIVVDNDSLLYFNSSNPSSIHLSDYSGNIKWTNKIEQENTTSPLLASNGKIYTAGIRRIFAFNESGDTLWTFELEQQIVSISLNIDKEGNVYAIDHSNNLYAISANGNLLWKMTDNRIFNNMANAPAFSPDGNILYVQGNEVSLLAIDVKTQTIKWTFGDEILYGKPTVDDEGNVYILPGEAKETEGYLYSLTPAGNIRWKLKHNESILLSSLAIDKNGNIYFGNDTLHSVSYQGKVNWKKDMGGLGGVTFITVDKNSTLFTAPRGNNTVISLSNNGITNWSVSLEEESKTYLPTVIGGDKNLFIPSFENKYIYVMN